VPGKNDARDFPAMTGSGVYSEMPIKFESLPPHTPGVKREIEEQWVRAGGVYLTFRFWHLLSAAKKNGDTILPGEILGYGDSTGASGGNHLHWSMKAHDGFKRTLDADNGYTGAFDFLPWYDNTFIIDHLKPTFTFTKTLKKGMVDTDVGMLQNHLVQWGYMQPFKADEVGIYGSKTSAAVLLFQIDSVPLSWYERNVLKGSVVGPKTIQALNNRLKK